MTNRGLTQLADTLTPCGSVTDRIAGARARDTLAKAAEEHGWLPLLDPVSPTLVPVFAALPYRFSLVRRLPNRRRATLENDPDRRACVL
jgi:glutamate-ammonia-ligase adenylyltransferase